MFKNVIKNVMSLKNPIMFFSKEKQDKILVVGCPKSGTTALYYNIKSSLPQNKLVHLFEPQDPNSVKYHLDQKYLFLAKIVLLENKPDPIFNQFNKKVLIARDPRDILVSALLYESGHHALWDKQDSVIKEFVLLLLKKEQNSSLVSIKDLFLNYTSFSLTLNNFLERLKRLVEFYDQSDGSFCIKYEDFLTKDKDTETGLNSYLNINLVSNFSTGEHEYVGRSKSCGDWRGWFNDEDVDFFKPLFAEYMQKFNYDNDDWLLDNTFSIPSCFCSEYFLKLVNKRRIQSGLRVLDLSDIKA